MRFGKKEYTYSLIHQSMKITHLLSISLMLFMFSSCRSQLTVRSATWHTWVGGQPGVGGTNYMIVLNNEKQKPFELNSLIIDGESLKGSKATIQGDSIVISASEKIKRTQPSLENPNPKSSRVRRVDPDSARINGTYNKKSITLEINSFEKTESISYQ